MKKMTIKRYADKCGITVQAAHKRILAKERYKEIVGVERVNDNFFLIQVNTSKGYTKNATSFQK